MGSHHQEIGQHGIESTGNGSSFSRIVVFFDFLLFFWKFLYFLLFSCNEGIGSSGGQVNRASRQHGIESTGYGLSWTMQYKKHMKKAFNSIAGLLSKDAFIHFSKRNIRVVIGFHAWRIESLTRLFSSRVLKKQSAKGQ